MAKTFLNRRAFKKALDMSEKGPEAITAWLEAELLKELGAETELFQKSKPIALGSLARGELCPYSDIDLLLVGKPQAAEELIASWQQKGLRIRCRQPTNPQNWTEGVDDFDVLALWFSRALTPEAEVDLDQQKKKIKDNLSAWRKKWIGAMNQERAQRAQRYDSISNYLEPNIKYGPGGLRDLQQAFYTHHLFEEKFTIVESTTESLYQMKYFLLNLRQQLQLVTGGDVLVASEQRDLSRRFGFVDVQDFNKEVQEKLNEVNFWADWAFAVAQSSSKKLHELQETKVKSVRQAFTLLLNDPGTLNQAKVRRRLTEIFRPVRATDKKTLGRLLQKYFSPAQSENYLEALFRSRLLYHSIPHLKRLAGHVQHDQYHRYTADAHILQAVRTLKRVQKRPKVLGRLAEWVREFTANDWRILLWTCLYHDLAKGLGGDHSEQGVKLVKKDFTSRGQSLRLTVETAWMVEHHLLLSQAAFRKNPHDPATWRELHKKGAYGKRLKRLAVFTAMDILATNPDAWNSWKEALLYDLVQILSTPKATKFMRLLASAASAKIELSPEFVKGMDPSVVEAVPTLRLIEDYRALKKAKTDLPLLVLRTSDGGLWIRFHRREDQPGIFLSFVRWLNAAGCSISESSVQTFSSYGVYDWFRVRSNKSPKQLKTLIELLQKEEPETKTPKVVFDQVERVSEMDKEMIVSFRGKNQTGLLLRAAQALFDHQMPVKWAKVHTWGRQIDDVFCVEKPPNCDEQWTHLLQSLR